MISKDIILEQLQADLSEPNLNIFKNSVDVENSENNQDVQLIVNDNYMKQWIENKCLSLIQSYFNEQTFLIIIKEVEETNENNQSIKTFTISPNCTYKF